MKQNKYQNSEFSFSMIDINFLIIFILLCQHIYIWTIILKDDLNSHQITSLWKYLLVNQYKF